MLTQTQGQADIAAKEKSPTAVVQQGVVGWQHREGEQLIGQTRHGPVLKAGYRLIEESRGLGA